MKEHFSLCGIGILPGPSRVPWVILWTEAGMMGFACIPDDRVWCRFLGEL